MLGVVYNIKVLLFIHRADVEEREREHNNHAQHDGMMRKAHPRVVLMLYRELSMCWAHFMSIAILNKY